MLESESMMDICALMISADKKAVAASLVLRGDDALRRLLQLAAMAPVRTRLTSIFKMDPLSDKESKKFILHRLELAKAKKGLFEPEAVTLMAACCRGNRRQIMNTAMLLLDEAYIRLENTVNAQTLLECELIQSDEHN